MSLTSNTRDVRDVVARIGRRQDSIQLQLHLIEWVGVVRANEPHFLPVPQAMQIPLLFKLLESDRGRAICANLSRMAFAYLPRHVLLEHQTEIAQLYLVGDQPSSLHLRFILERGAEVRYDVRSDVINSSEPGELVFESNFLRRLGFCGPNWDQ